MMTRKTILDNPDVELIEISNKKETGNKYNVFLLFGEHARELISPETGLNLIKTLCNKGGRAKLDG